MSLRRFSSLQSPDLEIEVEQRARSGRAWLWRILYILYCLEVGGFLLFLPWLGIWENNFLLYLYPQFRPIVSNSFLKGGVLGLGLVNIFIGIQEIVHFKKIYFSK
jgi:hypothetical protein